MRRFEGGRGKGTTSAESGRGFRFRPYVPARSLAPRVLARGADRDSRAGASRAPRPALLVAVLALLVPLAVLATLLAPATARASEISSIDIVAQLQKDGSMRVTDTRAFDPTAGTERCIPLENLADTKVSGFSVVLDGKKLTDVGVWDANKSREEEAGKSGIRKSADGSELCFGFGNDGTHTAVVTYTVTNVVKQLTDGQQAVYWEFIPKNTIPVDSVTLRVTNAIGLRYSTRNTRLWAFGYKGSIAIKPTRLSARTWLPIDAGGHMTMLAIFPDAPFDASSKLDKTADGLKATAEKDPAFGSDSDDSNGVVGFGSSNAQGHESILGTIFAFVGLAFVFLGVLLPINKFIQDRLPYRPKVRRPSRAGLTAHAKRVRRDDYYRGIPYDGPIEDLVVLSGRTLPGLASALVLAWTRERYIREDSHEAGLIFKHDEPALDLAVTPPFTPPGSSAPSPARSGLWDILEKAAGGDRSLRRNELNRYVNQNSKEVITWTEDVETESKRALSSRGLMREAATRHLGIFPGTHYEATPKGKDVATRILGFRNYLLNFSRLNQNAVADVTLWDEYMVWAGYLGIAEQAWEQLTRADPTYAARS